MFFWLLWASVINYHNLSIEDEILGFFCIWMHNILQFLVLLILHMSKRNNRSFCCIHRIYVTMQCMAEADVDGALIVQPINHKFDHSYVTRLISTEMLRNFSLLPESVIVVWALLGQNVMVIHMLFEISCTSPLVLAKILSCLCWSLAYWTVVWLLYFIKLSFTRNYVHKTGNWRRLKNIKFKEANKIDKS